MSLRMVSVKIHKPSISFVKSNKLIGKEKKVHNHLISKYCGFEYSYSLLCINNLMFNERCRIVARFKDFLILDDMTEFLRRFYKKKELKKRLVTIFNFYESYSKIFPNYMILPESEYLYRNIRRKQKMIDAFNQIKQEEEENRNSLKKELNNKEKGEMIVFNKSIQESINRYHPSGNSFLFNSIISGLMKYNNNIGNNNTDSNHSLISISLNKDYNIISNNNNNKKAKQSLFENDNNTEISLNSENSLKKIVQLLNKKYDNNIKINGGKIIKQMNNNNKKIDDNKTINNYNDKEKKNKNTIKKLTKSKKSYLKKININEYNIKTEKKRETINISTPPKNTSPGHIQLEKRHNLQKNSLNNNKKFISHKQAVSVSNNNNTIKIINNINNIIINDSNINKEMVININTNYFELNNTNINSINKINNNDNINKNIKNALIKKVKMKSKSKSKETSLNNKKSHFFTKKISTNIKTKNNCINNTVEEKRIHTYSNNFLNSINYDNKNNINNIINNNVINIHNNTISNTISAKTNKSKAKKQNNDNKTIKGIIEYKSINIKSIENIGNFYNNNKLKNNYTKKDINNKKVSTINVEHRDRNKKSKSIKKKQLEILIDTDIKATSNEHIISNKIQNKKTFEILNTDGKLNPAFNSNTYSNYYISTDNHNIINKNSNTININDKADSNSNDIKNNNNQIKAKLSKKVMSRKQKTNSLHISNNKRNNYFSSFTSNNKIIKELNSVKRNNIANNINFTNENIKNYYTQGNCTCNLDTDNVKTKKDLNIKDYKDNKEEIKYKKISAKEMKEKYHKFMQGNKFIHGSYDTSNRLHLIKKLSSLYNSHNIYNTNNNNITEISQRKTLDIRSPFKINNIMNTPGSKISNKNINSNIILGSNCKFNEGTAFKKNTKINKKDGTQEKNKYSIYKINGLKNKPFINDANNKKMKYKKK